MPIVGGIARGQGQSAAGGPLGCRPRQSPRGRAGSTGLATSSSAPSPSSGSLPTAAPSLPPRPRVVGGGPPGSGVALAHSGSPGSRAEGDVAVRPGQVNLCSNRGRRAAPSGHSVCDGRAAAESATFWEGKSVGTLGPAPGDGRPVYAHVYFTGSDVAAQNLERVVTLRHGSELFNPQSGSRSRAGRPGDWVGGGLASPLLPLSAATSQTPTSLPSNRDAGSLPFRFRHLGVGAGHNVPPAFPFRDADPAGGGGRWGVCAGCLRFGSRAGETFPHPPPVPAPEGSISP